MAKKATAFYSPVPLSACRICGTRLRPGQWATCGNSHCSEANHYGALAELRPRLKEQYMQRSNEARACRMRQLGD